MTYFVFAFGELELKVKSNPQISAKRLRDGLRHQKKVINTAQTHIPYILYNRLNCLKDKRRAVVSDDSVSDNGIFARVSQKSQA